MNAPRTMLRCVPADFPVQRTRHLRFIEPQLVEAEQTEPLHRVGFMILSHGAVSNWVMLDWWSSHILYHRIFRVEDMPPERFIDAPLNSLSVRL